MDQILSNADAWRWGIGAVIGLLAMLALLWQVRSANRTHERMMDRLVAAHEKANDAHVDGLREVVRRQDSQGAVLSEIKGRLAGLARANGDGPFRQRKRTDEVRQPPSAEPERHAERSTGP